MEKRTPLYDCHVAAGGKMVAFAGYLLPVQYGTGIIAEHLAVRNKAGLFDVSHMGEFLLQGAGALASLQHLLTNDFTTMVQGQCRYSPMCNENGGVIDDLLVYKLGETLYLLVVNAANSEKDGLWIRAHLLGQTVLRDISKEVAQLALQGPLAQRILEPLVAGGELPAKYYTFEKTLQIAAIDCLVSRTGYTGEEGFELYCDPQQVTQLWQKLLEAGQAAGLIPCGLGARDTLRLEGAMPLYGHEMTEEITPLEAGLEFFVKLAKPEFIGKQALEAQAKPARQRIGLKLLERGIARENCGVLAGQALVGRTTSGTHCPYLGYAVAMALVDRAYAEVGRKLTLEVRGRQMQAQVVALPFYKAKK